MGYTLDLSTANVDAALVVGLVAFAGDYLLTFVSFEVAGLIRAIGAAIVVGGGVLGVTSVTKTA